jgi:hypothetical protein
LHADDMQPQADQINRVRADMAARYDELVAMRRMVLKAEADLAAAKVQAQSTARAEASAKKKLAQIERRLS